MPMRTCRALHGWRRYGKRSPALRAIPQTTISSESPLFSRCFRSSRKRHAKSANRTHIDLLSSGKREFVVARKSSKKKKKTKKTAAAALKKRAKRTAAKKARKIARKTKKAARKPASKKAAKKRTARKPASKS